MGWTRWQRAVLVVLALGAPACATAPPAPPPAAGPAPAGTPAPPPVVAAPRVAPQPPLPEAFRSDDFVVAFARPGDTPETLAERHLGDRARAWMIEEYAGTRAFAAGQEVVIPLRPWNPVGVEPDGYQIVPILCYHNLAPQAKGRMVMAVARFEEQMRYLKAQGYHVVSLRDFLEFTRQGQQLPRKSVVLTFDDGYRSFREHAYPVLRELGFNATLFVYTDYVGAGRNALSWADLRQLATEGFDVQAHSKTHGDLRRAPNETAEQFARRMQQELVEPRGLFQRHLGRAPETVAYPYGRADDDVMAKTREAGYIAGFTVRRQGSPSFVPPLRINRSQIYAEMSLEEFARNLEVFHEEDLR